MRTSTLGLNHLSEALPPNTITVGVKISAYEFGGDTNIQSMADRCSCWGKKGSSKGDFQLAGAMAVKVAPGTD